MKNNLPWFQHDNDARNHPKMKALIARFNYAGYGQFWALNEIISHAEGARLDISKKLNRLALAGDLGLCPDDFDAFLAFLIDPEIDLVNLSEGILTTDRTSESYQSVEKARLAERDRKSGKKDFPPGKESFPPGNGDFPPGKDNRAERLRAEKKDITTPNSSSSPEKSLRPQHASREEAAAAPVDNSPGDIDPDLWTWALKKAKANPKARNPSALAKKIASDPEDLAEYEREKAEANAGKTRFLPDPPPCRCGAKLKADIRNGFARCPECGQEYAWDRAFEFWNEAAKESTA